MMIGLVWKPRQPRPDLVYDELTGRRERAAVDFRLGDSLLLRSPTHHEVHSLKTLTGEPVVEIRRIDGGREVYRSSLVAVRFDEADVLALGDDGSDGRQSTPGPHIVFVGKVQTPEMHTAQWRQVYVDIRTDIENGRVKPGDRIPTAEQLAEMYSFSPTTVLKALQILQAEDWIESRSGVGRFVRFRRRRQPPFDPYAGRP